MDPQVALVVTATAASVLAVGSALLLVAAAGLGLVTWGLLVMHGMTYGAVEVLRLAGARETGPAAFGLHFNPEPPRLDAETITAILKAFMLLNEALLRWAVIISHLRRGGRRRPEQLVSWMRYRRMAACSAAALGQGCLPGP